MKAVIAIALFATACVGYDNSQYRLRTAIDAQRGELDRCYSEALADDASTRGTMKLVVRVPMASNGQVDRVDIRHDQGTANPYLHNCVRQTLLGLPIGPAPMQDDLYVEYTAHFQPEG